jgi:hypothetical protein
MAHEKWFGGVRRVAAGSLRFCHIEKTPQTAREISPREGSRIRQQQVQQLFHDLDSRQGSYPMSRVIPYSPMHEPRKEVSMERMQEILAKHTVSRETNAGLAERSGAGLPNQPAGFDSPAPLHPPLEWEKPKSRDQMAVVTKCGRYSCCKIILNGRVTYECWALVPGVWFTQIALGLPSFDAAKAIAQKHADAKVGKP